VTDYPKTSMATFAGGTSPFAVDGVADYAFAFMANTPGGPTAGLADGLGGGCPDDKPSLLVVVVGIMQAKARGNVTLKTASMQDFPALQPNFIGEENDRATYHYAYSELRKILTPELGFLELTPAFFGGLPGMEEASQETIDNIAINALSDTFWHDSSTTPVGLVVDEHLKVFGIKGLRVADVSVLETIANTPSSPSAHLVGYHGAKLLLKYP